MNLASSLPLLTLARLGLSTPPPSKVTLLREWSNGCGWDPGTPEGKGGGDQVPAP